MPTKTNDEKPKNEKRDTRQSFFYPDHKVSFLADSQEEADKLLAEHLKEQKNNSEKEG